MLLPMAKMKNIKNQCIEHIDDEKHLILPITRITFPHSISYQFRPYISPPKYALLQSMAEKDAKHSQPLKVIRNSTWIYAGPLLSSLPPSFHAWSDNATSSSSLLLARLQPLLAFIHASLAESDVQCYWITIRATTPTKDYDMRRWHVDEDFFAPDFSYSPFPGTASSKQGRNAWKLCATLLGPSTVFLKDNTSALRVLRKAKEEERKKHQHQCTETRCLGCSTYSEALRANLSTCLSSHREVTPPPHAIVVFKTGQRSGAVHSEPRCNVDRVFINVVPGTEDELKKLMAKWGLGWPRAWCLGVDVRSDETESF
ncbi:hypothetical protein DE146DRAFT_12480 [Phaeosphaeria sp. MPI-PUGE-AT-0046c]|nr:hypothetical protein DE146DRAFT_12480 [Phaeosphaeria sp. MPI-PUGE-AT-0046c]